MRPMSTRAFLLSIIAASALMGVATLILYHVCWPVDVVVEDAGGFAAVPAGKGVEVASLGVTLGDPEAVGGAVVFFCEGDCAPTPRNDFLLRPLRTLFFNLTWVSNVTLVVSLVPRMSESPPSMCPWAETGGFNPCYAANNQRYNFYYRGVGASGAYANASHILHNATLDWVLDWTDYDDFVLIAHNPGDCPALLAWTAEVTTRHPLGLAAIDIGLVAPAALTVFAVGGLGYLRRRSHA